MDGKLCFMWIKTMYFAAVVYNTAGGNNLLQMALKDIKSSCKTRHQLVHNEVHDKKKDT